MWVTFTSSSTIHYAHLCILHICRCCTCLFIFIFFILIAYFKCVCVYLARVLLEHSDFPLGINKVLSSFILSCLIFILSHFVLSCHILSCLVLFDLILSGLVLSYFVLSCHILFCLILSYLIICLVSFTKYLHVKKKKKRSSYIIYFPNFVINNAYDKPLKFPDAFC